MYTKKKQGGAKKGVDAFCQISHLVHKGSPLEVQGDDKSERQIDPGKTKEEESEFSVVKSFVGLLAPRGGLDSHRRIDGCATAVSFDDLEWNIEEEDRSIFVELYFEVMELSGRR